MTRKDFELIAGVLREARRPDADELHDIAIDGVSFDFATALRAINPHFNRDRFLRAAGVGEPT